MRGKNLEESYGKLVKHFQNSTCIFRITGVTTLLLGINYFLWRYSRSMNISALWFSIPLLAAETYSFFNVCFFLLIIWRPVKREPPAWDEKPSVDVFITTYNEDPGLIEKTARAAAGIDWQNKKVFILDDGSRAAVRQLAERLGCGYITRGSQWQGKPRHAKAGNINNALLETSGEFILILDADQVPCSNILNRTIGYFSDGNVAFVQTPQFFYNIPQHDPFGVDAALFYGPIMQGKDSWNAAFFCGSNAVLRRESLMQTGLIRYVENTRIKMLSNIGRFRKEVKRIKLPDKEERKILKRLVLDADKASAMLKQGETFEKCSDFLKTRMQETVSLLSGRGMATVSELLDELAREGDTSAADALANIERSLASLEQLAEDKSLLDLSGNILAELNLTTPEEAIPVQPLVTESITEDMATALLLHAHGWKSVFHPEILARGLAPEDLRSALGQRLRWAKGTIQVLRRENPLTMKGLSPAQRLMYFNTIYSYLSGFFNLVLLLSPVVFLFFNIAPIKNWSTLFFVNFIPFYVVNKIMTKLVARHISLWRGEQYATALFPLWIRAVLSVYTGQKASFTVTPKQRENGTFLHLVIPQLVTAIVTAVSIPFYIFYWIIPGTGSYTGFLVNSFWGLYNILLLSGIIKAAVYVPKAEKQ